MPSSCQWQSITRSHLPRCCLKHVAQIRANIAAVDSGIKPSYLFDYAFVVPSVMVKFVEDLYEEGLTSNQLDVISVEENVFITRIELLLDHLRDACNEDNKKNILVDISKHLKNPKILTDPDSRRLTMSCFESINRAVSNSATSFKIVSSMSENNVTTLFGLLLGYPVVYWYSNTNTDSGNCLNMVPVRVVKVFCTVNESVESVLSSDVRKHCEQSVSQSALIYSWSYPDILEPQCQEYVVHWQRNLNSAASKQKLVKRLLFVDEVVTFPVLTM